jgi:hypothetical protein
VTLRAGRTTIIKRHLPPSLFTARIAIDRLCSHVLIYVAKGSEAQGDCRVECIDSGLDEVREQFVVMATAYLSRRRGDLTMRLFLRLATMNHARIYPR